MEPLDVWRVIHGAKWFDTQFLWRTMCLATLYDVDTSCAAPCLLCNNGKCGLSMVGNWVRRGLFKVEDMGIEQVLLPCAGQLEFVNVPFEGYITDTDAHGLLDDPCGVMHLPTDYWEVVHTDMMTCSIGIVRDGGRGPKMFPEPFPKGPCRFPFVLLITLQSCHTCTFRLLHFSMWWPCPLGLPGGSWGCSFPWKGAGLLFHHKCSWSLLKILGVVFHHMDVVVVVAVVVSVVTGVVVII